MTQVAKKANGTWLGAETVQPVRSEQCPAQGMGIAEAPPVPRAVLGLLWQEGHGGAGAWPGRENRAGVGPGAAGASEGAGGEAQPEDKEAQGGPCHSLEKEQNKNKQPSCTRRNLEWILAAISSQKWLSSIQTGCSGKWMNHQACRYLKDVHVALRDVVSWWPWQCWVNGMTRWS